jgi:oxygen-dependent protoporphyrinogen oxidase
VFPIARPRPPTLAARPLFRQSLACDFTINAALLSQRSCYVSDFVDSSAAQLPIAVIGAGLTGLSAAHHLARAGHPVRIFEAAPAAGGALRTELHPDGWLIEAGPNSLQENPEVARLLRALGLDPERLSAAPAAKNRYIVRDGVLRALPTSPPAFLTSSFFSFGTKLRLLGELRRRPLPRVEDLPLSAFIREHFGNELVTYALDPFISGIYAGNADLLSARHAFPSLWQAEHEHGSLIRAQIAGAKAKRARGEPSGPPPIISFRSGLAALPRALVASLPAGSLELDAGIDTLLPQPDGTWLIRWFRAGASYTERVRQVLLALPAGALAKLTLGAPGLPTSLASLDTLDHPPVTSVFLGYRRADVAHPLDGFGALIPSVEKRSLLGVLFSSTLFPGRAPDGHVALTVMVGGTRRPDIARLPLEKLLPLIQAELASLLGVRGEPVFVRHTAWPRAIPQYKLNHDDHLAVLAAAEARHRGLFIGGTVRDGISMTNCLAAGAKLATRATA